jgi:phenylpropionate dioxygenase-like ring-hydroxylating dioxygenase large terminal subunit
LAGEFEAWRFDRLVGYGHDTYEKRMNWKLGIDTFGETYHFSTLHRDTLGPFFYGNVQTYDVFGRNHRMGLCLRSIDELRSEPRERWHISRAALPVYYLFPNVRVNVLPASVVMVRIYPVPGDPTRSVARVSFQAWPEAIESDPELVQRVTQTFGDVIRDEDFEVASRSQRGSDCGIPEHVIFGRNEPALHHYHNTYREALGMAPLELLDGPV